MEIRLATNKDREAWNGYLKDRLAVSPLNIYDWQDILNNSYGPYDIGTHFFMALDNGSLCGLLPAYTTRSFKGKKRLFSLRFGCVADDSNVAAKILNYMEDFCRRNDIGSSLISTGHRKIESNYEQVQKRTVVMEFDKDIEATWKGLRDKTRNMIRKARRSGLSIDKGKRYLKEFYKIYLQNMIRQGLAVHNYDFFENLLNTFGNNAELLVAKKGDRIIGGTIILFSKDSAIYPFQAVLLEYRKLAPNDFMVWEAISLCTERGIFKLDMGESVEGSGAYRFKINFGGVPQDIYYYALSPSSKRQYSKAVTKRYIPHELMTMPYFPNWIKKRIAIRMKLKGRII